MKARHLLSCLLMLFATITLTAQDREAPDIDREETTITNCFGQNDVAEASSVVTSPDSDMVYTIYHQSRASIVNADLNSTFEHNSINWDEAFTEVSRSDTPNVLILYDEDGAKYLVHNIDDRYVLLDAPIKKLVPDKRE